jgi:hypothetical protein
VLALGIGLNAVMFSLCYWVAFAGRPFRDPSEIVLVQARHLYPCFRSRE